MSRMRIKSGNAEVELEVEGSSFESALEAALAALERMGSLQPAASQKRVEGEAKQTHSGTLEAGINTVVARVGGGSGRALLRAAAIHLSLVDGLESFSKDVWTKRAHEARDWQAGYAKLQTRDIKRMTDHGEIVEKAKDLYSLPSKALAEARQAFEDGL